jgi:hypothetical protein
VAALPSGESVNLAGNEQLFRQPAAIRIDDANHRRAGMQLRSAVIRKFGKAVKPLRLKRGMTQQQLVEACGLNNSYIGQIRRG